MAGGTQSYEFARRFAAAGHTVDVVTGFLDKTNRRGWFVTEEAGVRVHWLPVRYSNAFGFAARVSAFLRFAIRASLRACTLRADVVFATSTPLTIAIPAIWASLCLRAPLVFEVRDLWPEAPRQMGVLKNRFLLGAARLLERAAYRRSSAIITLSPGMREGVIATGIDGAYVTMIPNGADIDSFKPDNPGLLFRKYWNVEGKMVFLYFGTLGDANDVNSVIGCANELVRRGETRAVFVLHGDGKARGKIASKIMQDRLDHMVKLGGPTAKETMPDVVAASDVAMTLFANIPILQTCSPNKFFDTIAAGRPVLTNMTGWVKTLVEQHDCGKVVKAGDSVDFADKVQEFLSSQEEMPAMRKRARALAEAAFSRDKLAAQALEVITSVCAGG